LKYHRLHPEYIYTRIKNLQGKYSLRVILTLVDIPNHEDSLKEFAKTCLVNNCTLICCWSAAEAARYLELYKSYEKANFKAIQGQQGSKYAEKLVDFVTVPRGVNKTDAVSLVSNFGSLRNAINADPEQIAIIGGWGEVKVKRWCSAVEEPFRSRKAARREAPTARESMRESDEALAMLQAVATQSATSLSAPLRPVPLMARKESGIDTTAEARQAQRLAAAMQGARNLPQAASASKNSEPEQLSEGVAAALAKLYQNVGPG
jgi:DNA excision repair protein ERCC-1